MGGVGGEAGASGPGMPDARACIDSKCRGMGGQTEAEQLKARKEQTLAVFLALFKAGVPIVPGSDTGLVGFGLHREIELYVQAGMTPYEALRAATVNPAKALALDAGTIEPGRLADLVLVDGDPLATIASAHKVRRVIANGRVYDMEQLINRPPAPKPSTQARR